MIMHIFRLFSRRPDLVFDYISAYTALVQDELEKSKRRRIRRIICTALAFILAGAFVVVTSVAVMLHMSMNSIPLLNLLIVPGVLLFMTLITTLIAVYDRPKSGVFKVLNEQLQEDRQLIETVWRGNDGTS